MLGDASIRSDTTVRQLDNLVALSEYEMFGTDHTCQVELEFAVDGCGAASFGER